MLTHSKIKQKLRTRQPCLGSWTMIGHYASAEILAGAGFDWIAVDMEHASISYETLPILLSAISSRGAEAFVRIESNDPTVIKHVLDCGAGGDTPPLEIFYDFGYRTFGVELAPNPLEEVKGFCEKSGKRLNVIHGDMRRIPFGDASFSFVYSYNAIFFMKKADIELALKEMEPVLRTDGLCYVNLLSVDDPERIEGEPSKKCLEMFGSELFSFHEDDEADPCFDGFEILHKEKRLVERRFEGKMLKQAYLEYIARKL